MKDWDFEAAFYGIILTVALFAAVLILAVPKPEAITEPAPLGVLSIETEPIEVIMQNGTSRWLVQYYIDGYPQEPTSCPTEAYAKRLIAYLQEYRSAEWREAE